jgi:F-type H+-transporting ATPase subunit delta
MARPSTSARRYAEAVYEIARRDGTEDAWAVALDAAGHVLGQEEVLRIVGNPAIPTEDRLRAVRAALGAEALAEMVGGFLVGRRSLRATADVVRGAIRAPVAGQLGNLVATLVARRRAGLVPAIAAEYRRLLDRDRGIVTALVTSAAPLSADQAAAVQAHVESMTGTAVSLSTEVDPALLGGLTVRVGDRLLDASIRGRLERLRSQLLAGSRQTHGTGA